ncbi:hypothetical protein ACOQFO_02850 [Ureibacillus sp. MALMAid1270]|uniref:hypothetical protein n=1 Tax=Ureibacillus sp. MALMAid1270 TaxID=3411629 RepID=UPI003BA47747
MSKKYSIVFALFIGLLIAGVYLYYQNNPSTQIRTEISTVDEKTYDSIGGLEHVNHPEQENFKQLLFTFKFSYTDDVEEYHFELDQDFRNLLGDDIYWFGNQYEFDTPETHEFTHEENIVIYTGEVSNDEIKDLLSKGIVTLSWKENGEEIVKEYNIGESVVFLK